MQTLIIPSKTKGRGGYKPEAIVLHITEGSFKSAMSWIIDPANQASYHFIVQESGAIRQVVDVADTAWHAGKVVRPTWPLLKPGVNPNLYTIGIACAGFASNARPILQILSVCALLSFLSEKYSIPLTDKTFVFHREIRADKTCPGKVPEKSFFLLVAEAMKIGRSYMDFI